MVKDNLSTHKDERVRPLVRSVGCELLYLPPYSPDFSPIEEAFSKVKGLFARQRPGAEKRWWRLWARRSRQSLPETQGVSLSIADTLRRVNYFDRCCMAVETVGTSLLPLPYHNPGYLRAVTRVFAPERHGENPNSVC
jgi:DDE superfamily endonuclease